MSKTGKLGSVVPAVKLVKAAFVLVGPAQDGGWEHDGIQ